jgi:hypothetical protein
MFWFKLFVCSQSKGKSYFFLIHAIFLFVEIKLIIGEEACESAAFKKWAD